MGLRGWFFFVGIAGLNLFIYFPSFSHVARSDQLIYLANTAGIEDWISLAVKTYSYDRVPHIFEGFDAVLFRPFFFFFLGTEKYFFGHNFRAWQITGFILHLCVVWNLLRLLWKMRPGIFAALVTAFFSVLLVGSEMVSWHHVNGYLIFLSCILICLYHLYQITVEQQVRPGQLWILFFCLCVAVSTYELGLVYSVLFFIYLWTVTLKVSERLPSKSKMKISRVWYFLILLPGVLYVTANLIDLQARHLGYGQGQTVLHAFHFWSTLKRAFLSMYWCLYAGFFPGHLKTRCLQRTLFNAGDFLHWQSIFSVSALLKWQAGSALAMAGCYMAAVCKNWSWGAFKEKSKFVGLVFLMVLAQMVLIVMARINFKQLVSVLTHNSYYGYYFWMYFVIVLYCFYIAQSRSSTTPNVGLACREKAPKCLKIFALRYSYQHNGEKRNVFLNVLSVMFLSVSIGANSYFVYKLNKKRAKVDTLRYFLVRDIESHLKNAKETGEAFSFFIDPEIALELPWVKAVNDKRGKKYTFLELLYPDYFNKQNPRYIYKLGEDGIKIGRRY